MKIKDIICECGFDDFEIGRVVILNENKEEIHTQGITCIECGKVYSNKQIEEKFNKVMVEFHG